MKSSVSSVMNLTGDVKYAAVYARVSTEDQGKGFSIPTQLEACQKLAAREGYTVPEGFVLIDEGISGTTMDRPSLRKLRDLVNTKAIAAVTVIDPDRLSRNLGHQLLLAEEFERAGVKLLIVSHPMEPGPEGWMFFQMRGALAEYERAKLLERTRRGKVGRIQAGYAWGSGVPFGYRYVGEFRKGYWEVDDEEAAIVHRMFSLCISGMSTRKIATQLTAERLPTPSERSRNRRTCKVLPPGVWGQQTVRQILRNTAYKGEAIWGKQQNVTKTTRRRRPEHEWVRLAVPPIIDADTFEAAQQALRNHQRLASRNRKHEYLLFGGRLRCGRCGRGMSSLCRQRNIRYYLCNSQHQLMDRSLRCPGSLRADVIEPEVWGAVMQVLEHPELIAAEVARQEARADEQRAEIAGHIALIEAALAKCDREAQRWADAYAGEVINLAELKGYRAEIATRRQSLQAEHTACQRQLEAIGAAAQQVDALTAYCARVRQRLQTFDQTEKRIAIEALDIRVSWIPGEPLAIQGSIPLGQIAAIPSR
jgi:site-specific DNA recombinase